MSNTLVPSRSTPGTTLFGDFSAIYFSTSYIGELINRPNANVKDAAYDLLPDHSYSGDPFEYWSSDDDGKVLDVYLSYKDTCLVILDMASDDHTLVAINQINEDYALHRIPQLEKFIADNS